MCQEILHPENENLTSVKLGATFRPREKYVTHYLNLALYLRLGMKLKKTHRVLKFRQSKYLKIFVDKCTELRKQSTTDFEKDLWKKMANSAYGKTIEQVRSYIECKICLSPEIARKWISNPRFKSMKIMQENFVIIFLSRATLVLNKPISSGFTILEHSKRFMYQQYYEVIKPALGDAQVLMSDTGVEKLKLKLKLNYFFFSYFFLISRQSDAPRHISGKDR